ncbi:MAG: CaiB/BaiF CoA transferase family protein [Clostridia bacterium]
MAGALEGITVLDLSRVLAGPYCTMILGDLGADVIKVEGPHSPDETRSWGPPFTGGESAYFLCANRNKRAITLDLKTEAGKEVLKRLAVRSDVVVQNFKSGTLEKLGIGYETLRAVNPQIIMASITGFGQTGPYREIPGYDFIIQAMSGLMSITGEPGEAPMKTGVAIADILTGLNTAIAILAALHERDRTGEGQCIDVSLFDSQIAALVNVASNYLVSGQLPKRYGNQHPNIVPYQAFATMDQDIVVAVGNDRQFVRFAEIIDMPELACTEKFQTNAGRVRNREELIAIISQRLLTRPSAEWLAALSEHDIPNGPINDLEATFADPQVAAREMIVEMAHPTAEQIKLVGSPIKLSRTPVEMRRHPPLYGEHTDSILHELGYSEHQIDEFRTNHII